MFKEKEKAPLKFVHAHEKHDYNRLKKGVITDNLKHRDIEGIVSNIAHSRARLSGVFATYDFLIFTIKGFIRMLPCCKSKPKSKEQMFRNGVNKYYDNLDVVKLLKSVRLSKVLMQSTLTRRQQLLLHFQRQNLLDTAEDSSEGDDQQAIIKDLEHEKPMIRIFALGKIQQVLREYEADVLVENGEKL